MPYCHQEESGFFIADVKFFESIPDLVQFYNTVSLVASFPGLDTLLVTPFSRETDTDESGGGGGAGAGAASATENGVRETPPPRPPAAVLPILSYAIAMYDFAPTAVNHIELREGDRLAIVSKAGGDRGWWKGQVIPVSKTGSKKIGYFPMNYVKEEEDN